MAVPGAGAQTRRQPRGGDRAVEREERFCASQRGRGSERRGEKSKKLGFFFFEWSELGFFSELKGMAIKMLKDRKLGFVSRP